jgi:hypothetical protein
VQSLKTQERQLLWSFHLLENENRVALSLWQSSCLTILQKWILEASEFLSVKSPLTARNFLYYKQEELGQAWVISYFSFLTQRDPFFHPLLTRIFITEHPADKSFPLTVLESPRISLC